MIQEAAPRAPFAFFPGEIEVFKARGDESTFDWTRRNFRLVAGPMRGRLWDPEEAPYAKGIMDMWDRPEVRKIYLVGPSQGTRKTTIAYACGFARLCRQPGPLGIAMPDQESVERIFRERVIPHFKATRPLAALLSRSRYAEQKATLLLRDGSIVHGLWTGSESRMSSVSLETLLVDEEDAYQDKAAVGTLEERLRAYGHTAKCLRFSKPRGSDEQSTIWRDMQAEAQAIYEWEAVCPAVTCRSRQVMAFENIRVPSGVRDPKEILEKRLARYVCPHCGYEWSDYVRDKAVSAGGWRTDSKAEHPSIVGFHLPSWISPAMSLSKVMADWFSSNRKGPAGRQWFDNSHRAVPFETVVVETNEEQLLRLALPELPPQTAPDEALALTLAVDTQKDHFWYSIAAHSLEPRRDWIIDYGKVSTFDEIKELRSAVFKQDRTGKRLSIWRAAVDTGGSRTYPLEESRTQQVYRFLLAQPPGLIFGTKGMSWKRPGKRVDWSLQQKLPDGRKLKNGLRLYWIDTDAFKDEIFWRLSEESDGEEPIWFHAQTNQDYFRQILAERKVWEKGKEVWKQKRRDNHFLDCLVLHMAMVDFQWSPSLQAMAAGMSGREQPPAPPVLDASSRYAGRFGGGAFGATGRPW